MEPQIENLSDQAQIEMMNLLQELMKIGNFELLIRNSEFWKQVRSLKDPNFQSMFTKELKNFYDCPNCKQRVRKFTDGGYYCFTCQNPPQTFDSLTDDYKYKLNCLKCFKMLSVLSFIGPCYHLCGYCAHKEFSKGRNCCKICNQAVPNNWTLNCNCCQETKYFQDLHEIRCGCKYCRACLEKLKKQKKCLICQGVNLLNSETYTFNTRDQELCITCETNQKLQEFPNKTCCDLDVCRTCLANSGCPCSQ